MSIFKQLDWKIILLLLLLGALGFESYTLARINKEKDSVIAEKVSIENKLSESEKIWEDKWSKRYHEICGSPFDKCNFIPTSRNSYVGLHTSRKKETSYSLKLPDSWQIIAWAGHGLGVNFAPKETVGAWDVSGIFSKKQFEEKEGDVYCASTPENLTGVSPENKRLFLKYKNIKTEFGTLRLSWANGKENTNEFNLCQAVQEGYIDWITDTHIGHIVLKLEEEEYPELEKVIVAISKADVLQTIYQ